MTEMRNLMEALDHIAEGGEPEDIYPITSITSPDGDIFKFSAVRYNVTPNDLIVKIWYGDSDVLQEDIEIDYAVLKRIIDAIERKI